MPPSRVLMIRWCSNRSRKSIIFAGRMLGHIALSTCMNLSVNPRSNGILFSRASTAPLIAKNDRQLVGAQLVDHHHRVFAVFGRDIENLAVHVFGADRQRLELGQHMAAQRGQIGGVIGADIKHLLARVFGIGIQPHGKYRQLAGTSRASCRHRLSR